MYLGRREKRHLGRDEKNGDVRWRARKSKKEGRARERKRDGMQSDDNVHAAATADLPIITRSVIAQRSARFQVHTTSWYVPANLEN